MARGSEDARREARDARLDRDDLDTWADQPITIRPWTTDDAAVHIHYEPDHDADQPRPAMPGDRWLVQKHGDRWRTAPRPTEALADYSTARRWQDFGSLPEAHDYAMKRATCRPL